MLIAFVGSKIVEHGVLLLGSDIAAGLPLSQGHLFCASRYFTPLLRTVDLHALMAVQTDALIPAVQTTSSDVCTLRRAAASDCEQGVMGATVPSVTEVLVVVCFVVVCIVVVPVVRVVVLVEVAKTHGQFKRPRLSLKLLIQIPSSVTCC